MGRVTSRIAVRHRVKVVIDLIQDDDKLRDERKRAKGDNKDKYQGYTKDEIRMGKGGNYARMLSLCLLLRHKKTCEVL